MTEKDILAPEIMTPIDWAAYYHSVRAHLLIVPWKFSGSREFQLDPREWEWQWKHGHNLSHITTDREEAIENFSKLSDQIERTQQINVKQTVIFA